MKIAHEAPIGIMKEVRNITDYDYALPHLLDECKEYADFFYESKELGRYIILDNSLAELGEAYNFDRLKYWLSELKPNEFIVPDVWENMNETLVQAKYWKGYKDIMSDEFKDVTFNAVVQAKSYKEALLCYINLKELGYKKISFSYGADYYGVLGGHPNPHISKALGRIRLITDLLKDGIIEENDRIHLLGCSCPFEFAFQKNIKQIETIDTSNPVMLGIEEVGYNDSLTNSKPLTNLNSHFYENITPNQEKIIINNINKFRNFIESSEIIIK